MSRVEVLAALKISDPTLRRLIKEGAIKPLPGNPLLKKQELRFDPADVEKLKNG